MILKHLLRLYGEMQDVYKRQALRAVRSGRTVVNESDLEESIEAVSYTHLDVYKRQIY